MYRDSDMDIYYKLMVLLPQAQIAILSYQCIFRNDDFFEMFMPVGRAAQRSSEAETLQEVPPYNLDPPKIGQRPNELRSFQ